MSAQVWTMSADRYQAIQGVHQPYIAEISPMQYALMGKAAKLRYDRKRASEWDASAACKNKWVSLVIEAFDRGDFALDSASVHPDAVQVVRNELRQRAELETKAAAAAAHEAAQITSAANVQVGQRVWHKLYRAHVTITKVNRQSVRVQLADGKEMKSALGMIERERAA